MTIKESIDKLSSERGEQALIDWMTMVNNGADQLDPDAWEAIETLCVAMRTGADRAFLSEIADQLGGQKL